MGVSGIAWRKSVSGVGLVLWLGGLGVCFLPADVRSAGPTIYMREEPDGSVSFTDTPERFSDWTVFIQGRSRSGSRFKDFLKNLYLYDDYIRTASKTHDVPAALIKAVMMAESAFNPNARSSANAQGLMQLIPSTARAMGVTDPWDPEQNINGGSRFLRLMLKRFNGDVRKAVAAYNAGPRTVEKWNGIPPITETQEYVKRVEALYEQFQLNDLSLGR